MKKIIEFEPGFDYIALGPKEKEKYGRHGMTMRFILKGKEGAVSFIMFTGWLPRIKTDYGMWKATFSPLGDTHPLAAAIGYHSPKPLYKGQTSLKTDCTYLDGKSCYSDVSGLAADDYMAEFLNNGVDALWKKMTIYYKSTLC